MTLSQTQTVDNYVFDEHDLPGEIVDPIEELYEIEHDTPAQILMDFINGVHTPKEGLWQHAMVKYNYLSQSNDPEAVTIWKLISDMAYLDNLQHIIDNKPEGDHWVEIYRKSYQRLERMIKTYTEDPLYVNLGVIFDVPLLARELSGELLLEQTRPMTEARSFPTIDEYTGIHYQPEDMDFLTIPDLLEFNDKDGVHHKIVTSDFDSQGRWGGNLTDHDHEWFDEDYEGELPSASIRQMLENEHKVTNQYYELRTKFRPILAEFRRRIEETPLVKYANKENYDYAYETAIKSQSLLIRSFAKSLRMEYQNGVPVQNIAAIVMQLPFDISVNGNIDTVVEQFGEQILDSISEPAGIKDVDPQTLETEIDIMHNQTLNLMEEVANNYAPKHSAAFTKEVFKAVAEQQLPVKQATANAYDVFREVSPSGEIAYRQAVEAGQTPSQAMAAFYKRAHATDEYTSRDCIKSATKSKMIVLTASSGYTKERTITWNLAKYKAHEGELYVASNAAKESKKWLFEKLSQLNWGMNLIKKLAE